MRLKVASVASNTNSFGLRGMILISEDGQAWEVAANYINEKKKGDVIATTIDRAGEPTFNGFGFELPRRLQPDPPVGVVREIWGQAGQQ